MSWSSAYLCVCVCERESVCVWKHNAGFTIIMALKLLFAEEGNLYIRGGGWCSLVTLNLV